MSKINQWKEQYREIMEAFLELRDQFEDCEMVFDNMIYQIEIDRTVAYCKLDKVDDLRSQLEDAESEGLEFYYELEEGITLNVTDDELMNNDFAPVFFKRGTVLFLQPYTVDGDAGILPDDTFEGLAITVDDNVYHMPYSCLGDLI